MLVIGTLVAGSALFVGKIYQKSQKKNFVTTLTSSAEMAPSNTYILKVNDEQIIRKEAGLETNSIVNKNETTDAENEINRYLALSGGALALTVVGGLFYPPLSILSVPILFVGLKPFWIQAHQLLFESKQIGVALLDLIGIIGCLLTGQFFVAALASSLTNFSRKLLIKTEDHSRRSLVTVFGEQPSFVWVQRDGVEVKIPFDVLTVGDTIVIEAGQTIPIDGTIIEGVGTIDQRALTGETQPVEKVMGILPWPPHYYCLGDYIFKLTKRVKIRLPPKLGIF